MFYQGPAATGVTFGPSTPFGITKNIAGLDLPNIRNGDSSKPRTRGQYVGLDVDDARDMTLTFDVGPFSSGFGSYGTLEGALSAVRAVTNTQGTTEYPLWVQLPNLGLLAMMCRVRKRNVSPDIVFSAGNMAQGAIIQFHADDPYFYAAPTLNPSVGLPTPGLGFDFALSFAFSFGGASSGNTITVVNAGDAPCYPLCTITGPCLDPSITNLSMPGSPTLTFDIQLLTGAQLIVDLDTPQSATYFAAGSSVGSTAMNTLQPNYAFWALLPGTNVISFNSADTSPVAGTLTMDWSSTYSSVV